MKKNEVLNNLIGFVKEQKLKKSDKLPSERDLANILGISRATVRETLQKLEERGIVSVRRGSGAYMNLNADAAENGEESQPADEQSRIKDLLEARFMISPVIINCAAVRASEEEITALQSCIVGMSRAIVARELDMLVEVDCEFHRLLAVMTRNHKLTKIMEQLNSGNEIFWEYFINNDEFVNNVIFAGYVGVVNAIKRRMPEEAGEQAKRNIINACEWLSRLNDFNYCDLPGIEKSKDK